MDRGAAAGRLNARTSPAPCLDWARAEDGGAIAALLTEPLPGALRLVLGERCPTDDERHHALVVRGADGAVLGHGARTVHRLWLDGRVQWVGYLHGLRRSSALAGDGRRLSRALTTLLTTRATDEAAHDLTAILSSNIRARRVLEGGLPGAPAYHHIADYRTVVLDARVAGRWSDLVVRPCPSDVLTDVHTLIASQAAEYAPVTTAADSWWTAWRGDRLVGAVRRVERRATVAGYAPWLAALRRVINLGLRLTRRPTLPETGAELGLVCAAQLTVPEGDADIIRALLGAVARAGSCARVAWGLGASHALRPTLDALPAWRIDSRLYAVGERPRLTPRPISPEAAWL